MASAVAIASDLAAWIVARAVASPDAEVCGLLFGNPDRVSSAMACRNVAVDPARRFEIDPVALLAAHRRARAGGSAILGCYHSHPSGDFMPSSRDAQDASPDGSLWLIATELEVKAWRTAGAGAVHGRFDPVDLVRDTGLRPRGASGT